MQRRVFSSLVCLMGTTDFSALHGWLQRPTPFQPLKFEIPELAADGAGRGNAVAEIWLMRR